MAAVAVQTAMTCDKKDQLHPFFKKQEIPINPTPQQEHLIPDEKGTGKRKHASKQTSGGVESNASNQSSLLAFVGLNRTKQPVECTDTNTINGNDTHQAAPEPDTLEEDPSYERRKRRKTVSPEPGIEQWHDSHEISPADIESNGLEALATTPWHKPLLVEALEPHQEWAAPKWRPVGGDNIELQGKEWCGTVVPPTSSQKPNVTWATTSNPSIGPIDGVESGTDVDIIEQKDAQTQAGEEVESQADQASTLSQKLKTRSLGSTPQTPPAKPKPVRMIQLKGGKLASPPKPKAKPEPEPVDEKRKNRRKGKPARQLVAVMNYAQSSQDRLVVGVKIDRILSGDLRIGPVPTIPDPPNNKQTQEQSTANRPSPKKSLDPPKPPHPFFSGKPLSKPAQQPPSAQHVAGDKELKMLSPRKSAVTPGKIRAQVQAHRASLSVPSPGPGSSASFHPRLKKASSTHEAPWPWQDVVHVRGIMDDVPVLHGNLEEFGIHEGSLKRKQVAVIVRKSEDLIWQYSQRLQSKDGHGSLRIPERLVTTGVQIQAMISSELRSCFKRSNESDSDSDDAVVRRRLPQQASHPALSTMYTAIATSLTPFDKYECETQAWTQKYAPKCAAEVLQLGKEPLILRDWLQSSTVSAVDKGSNQSTAGSHIASTKAKAKPEKKKKRKRAEDMNDFIISSDDELVAGGELEELEQGGATDSRDPQQRSLVRGGGMGIRGAVKSCNAVLLSGPHGCGKTATVYAVAKELDFEVFEINSGSRRSGKDVLDKVGDMAENHLVQQVSKALSEKRGSKDEKPVNIEIVKDDTPDTKQGSMTAFFKLAAQKKKPVPKKPIIPAVVKEKETKTQQPRPQQKQSLILFEEVDVLFDEDKQFWLTVLALAGHSKRPIVMTCANENLVPLDSLSLHAILRFTAPPMDLAVDYLLLSAAREGHLLKRQAIETLYKSKGNDLRASITDMDFWCQIGIGDNAGGFNWMIDRWPPGTDVDEHDNTLRVASKDTYAVGMGMVPRDLVKSSVDITPDIIESLLVTAWDDWQLAPLDILPKSATHKPEAAQDDVNSSVETNLTSLQEFEFLMDCASAADVYCGLNMRDADKQHIDTTSPPLSDKARSNYILGLPWTLVQAEPIPDYSNMDTHLAITTQLLNLHLDSSFSQDSSSRDISSEPNIEQQLISAIQKRRSPDNTKAPLARHHFSHAFDPIAEAPITTVSSTSTTSITASSFDREFSIIALDIAPYVRCIAAHDLDIEQQRLKVSNLLSAGGGSKKMRMTRASRSAVEGGKRENIKRERWFDKGLNLEVVLATGGKGWAGMGGKSGGEEEGSLRSTREGSMVSVREGSVRSMGDGSGVDELA